MVATGRNGSNGECRRLKWAVSLGVALFTVLCACALLKIYSLKSSSAAFNRYEDSRDAALGDQSNAGLCSTRATLEKNALRKIQERASWFEAELPHERHYFRTARVDAFAAGFLFSPYYVCPFTMEKSLSVREHFDGGKWLCGVAELSRAPHTPCVAFSFGSNYDLAFEDEINAKRVEKRCEIHIFDPTMAWDKAGHSRAKLDQFISTLPTNYHFHELGLSGAGKTSIEIEGQNFNAMPLSDALLNFSDASAIDFLKFDIEGFEYDILETTEWEKVRVGVILFEVHGGIIERLRSEPYTMLKFHEHLGRLERAGFRVYSVEPVCSGCVGQFEVAAINKCWHPIEKFTNACDE